MMKTTDLLMTAPFGSAIGKPNLCNEKNIRRFKCGASKIISPKTIRSYNEESKSRLNFKKITKKMYLNRYMKP